MDINTFHCHDLKTIAKPGMGKILVTGATGYIGGRLVMELLQRGYRVRVMLRSIKYDLKERWPGAEIVIADAMNPKELQKALKGIHAAFYLIHSLLLGPKKFESADIEAAINFKSAAESENIKRIIYLGGLGDKDTDLSPHLKSRLMVAQELQKGKVPVTILRAAIIIGSGSASYEIINNLVKNSLVIFNPFWAKTKCQPICIRDIMKYLVGVLEISKTKGQSFDIGCEDILTYEKMLKIQAELLGKKRLFLPSIISNTNVFSYILSFLTPVPAPIIRSLMEGLKNDVICQDNDIIKYLPFKPISYRESLLRAMTRDQQDQTRTRWTDSYPPSHELAIKLSERIEIIKYKYSASIYTAKSRSAIYRSISRIGGKEGWHYSNWLWTLRGVIDRIILGVGISRGRRSTSNLRVNDVIDFWRVEALELNKKVLLRAEMKLPGLAWLEFIIKKEGYQNLFMVNAYFHTRSIIGKLYWNLTKPFHYFIFNYMIREIEKKS
ncbi:SDR family oxidoreductase [Spirochaetota bacterium]